MLEAIKKVLKSTSPAKDAHSVNLSSNGWHISAEDSDQKAIDGARLALELLRPHYDAVLVVFPSELAGFESMLQSITPQEKMLPLEGCTSEAFAEEALANSQTIFTSKYSLKALLNGRHEQDHQSVDMWIKGMLNLLGNNNAHCLVLMVGENPFGPDFMSKCRAIGVGRVFISDNDVSKYECLELPKIHPLSRQLPSKANGNPFDRLFSVTELHAGHTPPMKRFRGEQLIDMSLSLGTPKR